MLRVDFYVQHLIRHSASGIELLSGEPVVFQFPAGDRKSNNSIAHAQLVQVVQEVAPPNAFEELKKSNRTSFPHASSAGMDVVVNVEIVNPGQWRVRLRPGTQEQTEAPKSVALDPPKTSPKAAAPLPVPVEPAPQAHAPIAPAIDVPVQTGEPKINRYLRMMAKLGGSDLHLSSGVTPLVRLHGEVQPIEQRPPMAVDELREWFTEIMPERNRTQFKETNDTDFAHTIEGVARFRANIFMDRRGIGGVFRIIPFTILTPEQLGIPKQVLDLCWLSKGLVVVTGPTGSGKSTTLATLIDVVNQNRSDHVITIEDPIEFVHENKKCLINQREIATHTLGFKTALRAALREDPDIVLVGEMRDLETIAIAIETAETGHLVFGTLHTTTAPSTVDRIIDQFPPDRQAQIRVMLSESLRGVIAQVLCKKKGGGRAAAYEILITNPAVSNLIREGKTFQLPSVMQTGKNLGMQTMNDHLLQHVKNGLVEPEEAYIKSVDKLAFKDMLSRNNIQLTLSGTG